jgi:2-C-methyl-D-erythritol 4-phosphate cytidylyltransferase
VSALANRNGLGVDFRIDPDHNTFMTNLTLTQATSTSANTRLWALVPCAGSGSRAGLTTPKQYQAVAGQPMVLHTLAAFAATPGIKNIVVVVAPGDVFFDDLNVTLMMQGAALNIANCGGSTRAESVLNGLNAVLTLGGLAGDWVLVHDAARCLITPAQISALIDACQGDEVGGLLAHRLADTLKSEISARVVGTVDRSDKWLGQTPQMFRVGALQAALRKVGTAVTDESGAMEAMGLKPKLVPGSAQNFKVTYPEDFALAEAVLCARNSTTTTTTTTTKTATTSKSSPPLYDYP